MAAYIDMQKICNEMLDVLVENKVPIHALDRVLTHLKELAYINTPIQNEDLGNEPNGEKRKRGERDEVKKRKEVLEMHLEEMELWLEGEGIDRNSNLGQELLKQTKELINQHYEIRELKEKTTQILGRLKD